MDIIDSTIMVSELDEDSSSAESFQIPDLYLDKYSYKQESASTDPPVQFI